MNYYEILGVRNNATKAELKMAYRRLVKQYHPDLNNSKMATEKIRMINEAYEVLSEFHSKSLHDQQLSGQTIVQKPTVETETEKYRREYLKKKAHEEWLRINHLIKMKIRFYKMERIFCAFFFLLGILYTIDYYQIPFESIEKITSIRSNDWSTTIKTASDTYLTIKEIHYESRRMNQEMVVIERSLVFAVPARIGLEGSQNKYQIDHTLHSFRNVFSIIIILFSAVLLNNKEYTDFRLTCGIVPGFLSLFLILYVLFSS